MRTFSTCCAAMSAACGVKWMSATSGTRTPRRRSPARIAARFSALERFGAVTRTISLPAACSATISATTASVSSVSAIVIDWTRMGFVPPMPMSPTRTSRVGRLRVVNGSRVNRQAAGGCGCRTGRRRDVGHAHPFRDVFRQPF
jgi:hypothetical protein